MLCCLCHMSPWHERTDFMSFDPFPMPGRRDLDGFEMALDYNQAWVEDKIYSLIHFPSGTEREIRPGKEDSSQPHIHIFGSLELPYQCSRDEAYEALIPTAQEQGLILSKEHNRWLRIANPQTGRSYAITFDNAAGHISDLELFPQYAMELLPGEVRAVLPPLYSQEEKGMEAIAPVKFFTPASDWTWYATEYDGEDLFFGLVSGFEVELGYFSRTELESVRGPLLLPIERDLYYQPQSLRRDSGIRARSQRQVDCARPGGAGHGGSARRSSP